MHAAISLMHGEGGWLSRRLLEEVVLPRIGGATLEELGDSAIVDVPGSRIAFTTDAYTVTPLFFAGGDIGRLAVFGTVNDLVVAGARPLWLSLSFVIEEGLAIEVLERVLDSVAAAARETGVSIVAGDTKVVPRGAADGLFVTTSGLGALVDPVPPGPRDLRPGDALLVSGPIGRHELAVLASRDELGFDPAPTSDCGSLWPAADALRRAGVAVRAMRDATRGGVAAVLHEWAAASRRTLTIEESRLPVTPVVRGACELLGLDPVHMANEGTMLVAVREDDVDSALAALRCAGDGASPALIGQVRERGDVPVTVVRGLAGERPLDRPSGSPLPRIC
jgi:hydrogenase expression/formation protein HypE